MDLHLLFADKLRTTKEKTELVAALLLKQELSLEAIISFAETQKDPLKATCIEAMEFATKSNPKIASLECFEFVTEQLDSKTPRIKWEAAKVIGNTAFLFPEHVERPISKLLENTKHSGTVVRWSAAYALGKILQSAYVEKNELRKILLEVCESEPKNSIQKIYQKAFVKV